MLRTACVHCSPVWYNDFVLQPLLQGRLTELHRGNAAAATAATAAAEAAEAAAAAAAAAARAEKQPHRDNDARDTNVTAALELGSGGEWWSTFAGGEEDDDAAAHTASSEFNFGLCTQEEGDAILVPHEWGHVRAPLDRSSAAASIACRCCHNGQCAAVVASVSDVVLLAFSPTHHPLPFVPRAGHVQPE